MINICACAHVCVYVGPPDPPAGRPVVSVLETSADVTWSSPAYDGGCMVTGYGVEVRPFNQSDWKLVADK